MKTQILILILSLHAPLFAESMYMPVLSASIETKAMGDFPAIRVSIRVSDDGKQITHATLHLGEERIEFPAEALSGIEVPDLSSLRVEVEQGRDGGRWVSIVLKPIRHTDTTRFHISVIDGTFAQVTRTWDEANETHIHRRREILHQE